MTKQKYDICWMPEDPVLEWARTHPKNGRCDCGEALTKFALVEPGEMGIKLGTSYWGVACQTCNPYPVTDDGWALNNASI
jgi:hypothetical protein